MRAGVKAFATRGHDAATTKMIAAEAGLNEQLITRYFGGKAGLLLALVGAFVDENSNNRSYPPAAAAVRAGRAPAPTPTPIAGFATLDGLTFDVDSRVERGPPRRRSKPGATQNMKQPQRLA